MKPESFGSTQIAKALGIGPARVYECHKSGQSQASNLQQISIFRISFFLKL
jgi:hypothetical protein